MIKGLEALNYLGFCQIVDGIDCEGSIMLDYLFRVKEEKYNIIEKELKALEIIIKKNVDVEGFKEALKSAIFLQLETYNNWVRYDKERILVEEEFNTLKGVLENVSK